MSHPHRNPGFNHHIWDLEGLACSLVDLTAFAAITYSERDVSSRIPLFLALILQLGCLSCSFVPASAEGASQNLADLVSLDRVLDLLI